MKCTPNVRQKNFNIWWNSQEKLDTKLSELGIF